MKRICIVVAFVCLTFALTAIPYPTFAETVLSGCEQISDSTSLHYCNLAQRFRPYMKFQEYEYNHPCSWEWFVDHSVMCEEAWRNECWAVPDQFMDFYYDLGTWGLVADIRRPYASLWEPYLYLRVADNAHGGEDWSFAKDGEGFYAHVEQVPENPDLVNIEYWTLYAYNAAFDNPLCVVADYIRTLGGTGNHLGDLTVVTLVYSQTCDQIIRATFTQHGTLILDYDLTAVRDVRDDISYEPLSGKNETVNARHLTHLTNYYENLHGYDFLGHHEWHTPCTVDEGGQQVYFVQDPESQLYEHIAVFPEGSNHEPWPAPCGGSDCMPKHSGNGQSFLPAHVTFLGSMSDMNNPDNWNAPFIYFNGLWGDPHPPIMHRQWFYPDFRARSLDDLCSSTDYRCLDPNDPNYDHPPGIPDSDPYDHFVDPDPYLSWSCNQNGQGSHGNSGHGPGGGDCVGHGVLLWPPASVCALALEVPYAKCSNVTVTSGSSCTAGASVDNGSTCPGFPSCTLSQDPPAPYPLGSINVTLTATNEVGNSDQCSAIVAVVDNTPPSITPPSPVTASTGPGATICGAVVSDAILGNASAIDNCPGVGISRSGVPAGNVFPLGNSTVSYTATDSSGNTATATQSETVIDNTPPSITAPSPVTVSTGPGATICGAVVSDAILGNASAIDNCPGVGISRSGVPAGNVFPLGNSTISYTATDSSGNTATATQSVTVIDNTSPTITNATVTPNVLWAPNLSMVPVTVAATASDNCGAGTTCKIIGIKSNEPIDRGGSYRITGNLTAKLRAWRLGTGTGRIYTITVQCTDIHGNSSTKDVTVTVPHNAT